MIQTLNILTPKICVTMSTYKLLVIYFCPNIKVLNKVYNHMRTATFEVDAYYQRNMNFS